MSNKPESGYGAALENMRLKQMLHDCFVLSGADTNGDGPEHTYADAVEAVRQLAKEYEESLNDAT